MVPNKDRLLTPLERRSDPKRMARPGSGCLDSSKGVIIWTTRSGKGAFIARQYEFGKTSHLDSLSHFVSRQGIPLTGIRFDSDFFVIEK